MSINGKKYDITRIISGRIYDTTTAKRVMHIDCHEYGDNVRWENTDLYRSPLGTWFLAGEGNASSRWGKKGADGSYPGDGIQLLTEDEAKAILEEHDGPYAVYFEYDEG